MVKHTPFRFPAAMVAALVAFVAVFGAAEVAGWRLAVDRYEQEVVGKARRLLQNARETFDSARLPLVALAEDMETNGITSEGLAAIERRIARQVNASPRLSKLLVVGADGRVVAGARREQPKLTFSSQHFFEDHRSSLSRQIKLGKPILNPFGDGWVIPVTQRFSTPDGHFGGVVAALFESTYFANIYEKARVRPDDVLLLTQSDGRILATLPSYADRIGSITKLQAIVTREHKARFFPYHYLTYGTKETRIAGLAESPRSGLVMIVAMSEAAVVHDWINGAWPRWLLAIVLIVVASLLSYRLNRQEDLRQKSERQRNQLENEFKQLAEASSDAILRLRHEGFVEYVSPASTTILGVMPNELVGKNLVQAVHADDVPTVTKVLTELQAGRLRKRVEFRAVRKDGSVAWLEATLGRLAPATTTADEDNGIVAIVRDITRSKELHKELVVSASTDALTGLANRGIFDERLGEMIAESVRVHRPLSFLMIDADNFKLYNDTYGHIAGDDCLRAIAHVLQGCTRRRTDLVARYGGEEFAILLSDTEEGGAEAIATDIREAVSALKIEHRKNLPWGMVTVSIGIATIGMEDIHEAAGVDLVGRADAALYRAKAAGRNTFEFDAIPQSAGRSQTAA